MTQHAATPAPAGFEPTRAAGLARLARFVPHAGRDYAARRNYDLGAAQGHRHVSGLSPYIRHRLISEEEVLRAVLSRFSLSSAEKFVQEVYWRTYWKGWLEMRPTVWAHYRDGVRHAQDRLATEGGLRRDWEAACRGETGIACFDHWAQELTQTGYLHNHARMWMASIWIFTLRLPWELGADLFLRQLLDGDPASNTLGWRWVAGIQTPGKTYLAQADNIARYTEGRFNPAGQLALDAEPVSAPPTPPKSAPPEAQPIAHNATTGWLLTEDDMLAGFPALPDPGTAPPVFILRADDLRSPLATAPPVSAFTSGALQDTVSRHADRFGTVTQARAADAPGDQVAAWARAQGLTQVVTPYAPVGPGGDCVAATAAALRTQGIALVRQIRPYDLDCWPHATHGFFRFKEKIPRLIGQIKGISAA